METINGSVCEARGEWEKWLQVRYIRSNKKLYYVSSNWKGR